MFYELVLGKEVVRYFESSSWRGEAQGGNNDISCCLFRTEAAGEVVFLWLQSLLVFKEWMQIIAKHGIQNSFFRTQNGANRWRSGEDGRLLKRQNGHKWLIGFRPWLVDNIAFRKYLFATSFDKFLLLISLSLSLSRKNRIINRVSVLSLGFWVVSALWRDEEVWGESP